MKTVKNYISGNVLSSSQNYLPIDDPSTGE